jgi:glucose/mannose transport system permease protein
MGIAPPFKGGTRMTNASLGASANAALAPTPRWRQRLSDWTPRLVLAPSLIASFVYVFLFTFWTLYISLSNSTLLPTYAFVGIKHYFELWSNKRWEIAYGNLFFFSGIYVVLALAVGLALAIAIDQRVRFESFWRTIFLYPLAVSFVVTGTVWSWLYSPNAGIEFFVRSLGWMDFTFRLTTNRDTAIYAIIATGVWQSSGFAMALFLAGLRSVDPDLIKAAQIDGASRFRIYRKVILPTIAPIFVAVAVVLLQFAIKTFDLVVALTGGGPGIATTFPATYVYDLMFQRGEIAVGAAAAIMMLAALAVVLVPYPLWTIWRNRREAAAHG